MNNIVRQLAFLYFGEAINFLVDPYYQVLAYLMIYYSVYNLCFNFYLYVGLVSTVVPKSSSTVMVHCSPQRQQNVLAVSQSSGCMSIENDSCSTSGSTPVTTLSVIEHLTTSSSVATSISGQLVSTITTTAG